MPLARNSVFGIALSRELLYVVGPDGPPAAPIIGQWRAMSLGSNAGGVPPVQVIVQDADIGITIYPFDAPPVIPVGAPPAGSRVQVTYSPMGWALGLSPLPKPTLPGPQGVVFVYFAITTLFGATFAQVILDNGAVIATLPEELSIIERP